MTALEAVQSNLASFKEAFDRISAPGKRNSTRPYASGNQSQFRRRQCNSCRTAGVDNCFHCFKCGSTDHFARGCRRVSRNGHRLRQRDRVQSERTRPTMSANSVERKRVLALSSKAIVVKLLDIVQGNVNRNTGDNIRHFARPYPLWKSESVEKTEKTQVSL